MVEYYQLEYGYKVRILDGTFKGREGIITMGSRFGDIGISFKEKPKYGYDVREPPQNLEIICKEDTFGVKKEHAGHDLTPFEFERWMILQKNPEYILQHPEDFDAKDTELAKKRVEMLKDRQG